MRSGPKIGSQHETYHNNEVAAIPKEDSESTGFHSSKSSASVSGDEVSYAADEVVFHGLNGHWSRK